MITGNWTIEDGEHRGMVIRLLTPDGLSKVPDGMALYSIFGKRVVVGKDHIDDDTRFEYTAFGYPIDHKGGNSE